MQSDSVLKTIEGFLNQIFITPVALQANTSARDVEEWDSVAQIQLLILLESHYGIRFGLGEAETLKNVGELVSLIQKKSGSSFAET